LTAFFRTANPIPLAFAPSGSIVLGQSDGGNIGLYTQTGTYVLNAALPLASIRGIATDSFSPSPSATPSDVYVIGTPQAEGGPNVLDVVPGGTQRSLAVVSDPHAIVQDSTSGTIYITNGSRGDILALTYGTWTFALPIPSARGFTNPGAIAIAY
jgi:hypothetical protein